MNALRFLNGKTVSPFLSKFGQFRDVKRCFTQKPNIQLAGIFPPIPTPFNDDESIAFDKLHDNLEKWRKIPFSGYVVQGSNGEYAFLSENERVEVVRRVRQMIGTDKTKLLIAGSGCESTRATVKLSEEMAAAGADAVLIVTPCYYKSQMNDAAMIAHYRTVADNCPVPVILYSVPANTGVDLSPECVRILSEHPNIIGLKDSGGDITKIGRIVHETRANDFQVLAGSAGFLLASYSVGCVGGVCALANVIGERVCELHSLSRSGENLKQAAELQHKLILPNAMVTRRFGVPALKRAMEWFGYYGGPTRLPLLPLGQKEEEIVKNSFKNAGFL